MTSTPGGFQLVEVDLLPFGTAAVHENDGTDRDSFCGGKVHQILTPSSGLHSPAL